MCIYVCLRLWLFSVVFMATMMDFVAALAVVFLLVIYCNTFEGTTAHNDSSLKANETKRDNKSSLIVVTCTTTTFLNI